MTRELAAERGLTIDEAGFESLMEAARVTSRASAKQLGSAGDGDAAAEFARSAGFETDFVGYEVIDVDTVVGAVADDSNGAGDTLLVKLERSPFYPAGGGQVSDSGVVVADAGQGRVVDVVRVGLPSR